MRMPKQLVMGLGYRLAPFRPCLVRARAMSPGTGAPYGEALFGELHRQLAKVA